VATATGESQWISSEESRADAQVLRGRVDGIVVGIGTALQDDPLLMARPPRGRDIKRLATRIVLDGKCRLPVGGQLMRTIPFAPLLVVHAAKLVGAAERRRAALAARGAMTVGMRADKQGRVTITALLKYLGNLEYTNLMVEGGPEVMAAFFSAGCVDEAWVYVAPTVMGGPLARRAIGGPDLKKLADAKHGALAALTVSGGDVKLTYRF
jgi:diaminohydroxyphosphoribosylaminopyrimidine deaminase/5-amino-6-(5-phosphoribosylamino)uracil reductase